MSVRRVRYANQKQWPMPTGLAPSLDELFGLESDGLGIATDGCEGIEADGVCPHGYPSWLKYLGLI
jgi:hypothetical protein